MAVTRSLFTSVLTFARGDLRLSRFLSPDLNVLVLVTVSARIARRPARRSGPGSQPFAHARSHGQHRRRDYITRRGRGGVDSVVSGRNGDGGVAAPVGSRVLVGRPARRRSGLTTTSVILVPTGVVRVRHTELHVKQSPFNCVKSPRIVSAFRRGFLVRQSDALLPSTP
jgi:hypothetical protein